MGFDVVDKASRRPLANGAQFIARQCQERLGRLRPFGGITTLCSVWPLGIGNGLSRLGALHLAWALFTLLDQAAAIDADAFHGTSDEMGGGAARQHCPSIMRD